VIRTSSLLLAVLLGAACKPKHSCEQPGRPVAVQLLAASQPILNPDDDGVPWPTNLRIYELKHGADLQNLEFEVLYRDREKTFGDKFIRAHEYEVFPARQTRWTFELSPETEHIVTVGLFRRPFGDAWYQVYDVPKDHAARRCEAEERGSTLPDPCVYLAFESSEIDGGAFPPADFDLTTFEAICAPVVQAADDAKKNKKKRRKPKLPQKLPTVPSIPELPKTPQAPELPQLPQAPQGPQAPSGPQAPQAPQGPSTPQTTLRPAGIP